MTFHWFERHQAQQSGFEQIAASVVRAMSSSRFLMLQTVIICLWMAANVLRVFPDHWDNYPFILLNLALSLQAAYAGPLILIASRRQEDRDRHKADADHEAIALILKRLEELYALHRKHGSAPETGGGPMGRA